MRTKRRSERCVGPVSQSLLRRGAVAVAVVCVLVTSVGAYQAAKDEPTGTPKKRVLFDGKSLDGWKKTDFGGEGAVKVEEGAVIMSVGRPMSGITSTHKDLPTTNYELSYEAKRLSGVDFFAAATFPVGKSHVTLVNGGWGGSVTGLSSIDGADASENETNRFFKYQDKTWYKFRVRVSDEAIRCWIDDKEIIAVDYQGRQVGTRIETRESQPLGFATWETSGAVRNIEVRMLTPAEIAANKKAE
jgi:Domain of Unknown Function (DUF1080)